MENMRNLKQDFMIWKKLKNKREKIEIQDIEKNIDLLVKKRTMGSLTAEDLYELENLRIER